MSYKLFDKSDQVVANLSGAGLLRGVLKVNCVKPWWPIGLNDSPGYLYNLKVGVVTTELHIYMRIDSYTLSRHCHVSIHCMSELRGQELTT